MGFGYKRRVGIFDPNWLRLTLLMAPPFLLSLTLHEYAHARTALAFGDPTAKNMGRVSFNPLAHLDLIGTLVLMFTHAFGWARPIPVNPHNLDPPRLGDICVSIAGPLANLSLAVASGLVIRLLVYAGVGTSTVFVQYLYLMLLMTLTVNVCLCVFNLLPLWPLDGHHIARELLPADKQAEFMRWQMRYGIGILVALLVGPRILETILRRDVFDPVGFVIGNALGLAVRVLDVPWEVLEIYGRAHGS